MNLSKNFWKAFEKLVLVGSDGKIVFTAEGRKKLGSQFAKHGFNLSSIKTVDQFRETMRRVAALDLAKSNHEFEEMLQNPSTSAPDRARIRRVLGLPAE